MSKQGLFIVIEGPNGAGKSTTILELEAHFKALGREVITTREPGGTHLGEGLRAVLKNPDMAGGDYATALVFNGARKQHADEVILPAVARGAVVICDRYYMSTDIYQGILSSNVTKRERDVLTVVHNSFPQPDLTVFIIPELSVMKSRPRDKTKDRFEKIPVEMEIDAYRKYAAEFKWPSVLIAPDATLEGTAYTALITESQAFKDLGKNLLSFGVETCEQDEHTPRPVPPGETIFDAAGKYPLVIVDPKTIRVWVQLDGFTVEMLTDMTPLSHYFHEAQYEIDEMGLDYLVKIDANRSHRKVGEMEFTTTDETWAKENGFISDQPFQVEIYAHHYMSHGLEGDEGDCDLNCTILKKNPVSEEDVKKFWEEHDSWTQEHDKNALLDYEANRIGIFSREDLLYVSTDRYGEYGTELSLSLRSRYNKKRDGFGTKGPSPLILSVGSHAKKENPTWEDLYAQLKTEIEAKYPQFKNVDLKKITITGRHPENSE